MVDHLGRKVECYGGGGGRHVGGGGMAWRWWFNGMEVVVG